MKSKRFIKLLPCDLTQSEVLVFGQRNALAVDELAKVEAKKKAAAASFKAEIDGLKEQIADFSACVNTEQQLRAVDCEQRWFPARGVVEVFRLDTGEVIDSRAMTREELDKIAQLSFDEISADAQSEAAETDIADEMNAQRDAEMPKEFR